jgi:hypothetical protein
MSNFMMRGDAADLDLKYLISDLSLGQIIFVF